MKTTPPESDEQAGIRLNKYIAHCGIASRRKAGELIQQGHVRVDGEVVREIGFRVMPGQQVTYQGKPVKPVSEMVYLLLNKPKDYLTTTSDDRGRKTVLDLIKRDVTQRVYPVGRLDRMSTGLLLLTNDGELAQKLAHPSYEIKKIYHVVLDKPVKPEHLEMLRTGVELEDGLARADAISHVQGKKQNEVGIELHSGKNRIIRRMFTHLGYRVQKLDRVYYAGLTKKDLPRGRCRHLTKREVIMLKHFV
ncbi:MAG: pseudouridine synthase [Saprospiraceae bacterium]|nr:pseudouridine synthase [Saprospiraceae bacterium]